MLLSTLLDILTSFDIKSMIMVVVVVFPFVPVINIEPSFICSLAKLPNESSPAYLRNKYPG